VSGPSIEANPVTMAFDAAGNELVSWRGLRGADPDATVAFRALDSRSPARAWEPPRTLPRSVLIHDAAMAGAGRFALVTEREPRAGHARTRSLVTFSLGTLLPLRLGRTVVLARGPVRHVSYDGPQPTLFTPVVAATPGGTVVAAWQRAGSGVWAKTIGQRARRLGPFGGSPSLHLAADGSGLLTWRRGSRILARVRSASGAWGPIEQVAAIGRYAESPRASVAGADGDFAVGVTEVIRSAGGVHWRSSLVTRDGGWHATLLEDRTFVPDGTTSFITDNLRTLVTMTSDGQFRVARPGMLGADVAIDDIASGPAGRWAVTWFDANGPNLVEFGDGAPQQTNGLATGRAVVGSRVGFDPVDGRPQVVWSQQQPGAVFDFSYEIVRSG
jgi:hypothetical protein